MFCTGVSGRGIEEIARIHNGRPRVKDCYKTVSITKDSGFTGKTHLAKIMGMNML